MDGWMNGWMDLGNQIWLLLSAAKFYCGFYFGVAFDIWMIAWIDTLLNAVPIGRKILTDKHPV